MSKMVRLTQAQIDVINQALFVYLETYPSSLSDETKAEIEAIDAELNDE